MDFKSTLERRRFLQILSGSIAISQAGWSRCDSGMMIPGDDLLLTPSQTEGPFYPVPTIEQQMFNDVDLTKKLDTDSLSNGQQVAIGGKVTNAKAEPLNNSIVEIWQASTQGQYNHPSDAASDPGLDSDFQFWGRMITSEDGRYEFKTIIPGKYPGRTGRHIHFRVDSPGYRRLSTQSYFSNYGDDNSQDGLYQSLSAEGRNQLTVEFNELSDQAWPGEFNIVLAS